MAFSGVRTSWLMRDRNSVFARLARWASSAATRSVVSRTTVTAPTGRPRASHTGVAVTHTWRQPVSVRGRRTSLSSTRSRAARRRGKSSARACPSASHRASTRDSGWPRALSADQPDSTSAARFSARTSLRSSLTSTPSASSRSTVSQLSTLSISSALSWLRCIATSMAMTSSRSCTGLIR